MDNRSQALHELFQKRISFLTHEAESVALAAAESVLFSSSPDAPSNTTPTQLDHPHRTNYLTDTDAQRHVSLAFEKDVYVRAMTIAGGKVWCAGDNGQLTVYSTKSFAVLHRTDAMYNNFICCMSEVVVGRSRQVWAGCQSGKILVHDNKTYQCIKELRRHAGTVLCLTPTRVGVFSGSADFTVLQWHLTGVFKKLFAGHVNRVKAVLHTMAADDEAQPNEDGLLWSGGDDLHIRVWDLRLGSCVRVLVGHTDAVTALALHQSLVWSASLDGTLRAWTLSGTNLHTLLAADYLGPALHPTPHGMSASASTELQKVPSEPRRILSLQALPTGLLASDADGQLTLWFCNCCRDHGSGPVRREDSGKADSSFSRQNLCPGRASGAGKIPNVIRNTKDIIPQINLRVCKQWRAHAKHVPTVVATATRHVLFFAAASKSSKRLVLFQTSSPVDLQLSTDPAALFTREEKANVKMQSGNVSTEANAIEEKLERDAAGAWGRSICRDL
jgi:F-box/WD-40 domain protein 7